MASPGCRFAGGEVIPYSYVIDRGEAAAASRVPAELWHQPRHTLLRRKELALAETYFLSCWS